MSTVAIKRVPCTREASRRDTDTSGWRITPALRTVRAKKLVSARKDNESHALDRRAVHWPFTRAAIDLNPNAPMITTHTYRIRTRSDTTIPRVETFKSHRVDFRGRRVSFVYCYYCCWRRYLWTFSLMISKIDRVQVYRISAYSCVG